MKVIYAIKYDAFGQFGSLLSWENINQILVDFRPIVT